MPFPVIFEQAAKADVRQAREWLENKKPGLGNQFRDELDETLNRIASDPLGYAIVERRTRQLRLRSLTYVVSYIFFEDRVHVNSILHGRRDPTEWQKRS